MKAQWSGVTLQFHGVHNRVEVAQHLMFFAPLKMRNAVEQSPLPSHRIVGIVDPADSGGGKENPQFCPAGIRKIKSVVVTFEHHAARVTEDLIFLRMPD